MKWINYGRDGVIFVNFLRPLGRLLYHTKGNPVVLAAVGVIAVAGTLGLLGYKGVRGARRRPGG